MSKPGLHPRNRHRDRYDFARLTQVSPKLARFVAINAHGDESIDFADPEAVKALNQAILKLFYDIADWDIPEGFLCPPIPGRADYIHHAADLLASGRSGEIPRGSQVRVLDIGTGANCVYPLIGHREYGWSFVGSEIHSRALESAGKILEKNPALRSAIELRLQKSPERVLEGIIAAGDRFDLTICNPPFHSSPQKAQEGSRRKWRNLGKHPAGKTKGAPILNFGGQGSELWCKGGERAFVLKMIEESARFSQQCRWFSSMVSKSENLPAFTQALKRLGAGDPRVIEMAQGQKKSRILAWRFPLLTSGT